VQRSAIRGATLHQKVVVTGVWDIWRARGARAYNGGLGAEPPAGSRNRVPSGGGVVLLEGFRKITSKSVHKFSTFTTYMQELVSYFATKTTVTRLLGVREAVNPTHLNGNFSLFK